MKDLNEYTKKELIKIASWYGCDLPSSMLKAEMIEKVEVLLHKDENVTELPQEQIQMSVRIRRIKEQNSGN